MKRDMELIRKLILSIEDHPSAWAPADLSIDGYTQEQIAYHAYLLVDAGLATGVDVTHLNSPAPAYRILHLTWAGHEFADACREENIWRKAMDTVKRTAGTVSFQILKELLVNVLREAVGVR